MSIVKKKCLSCENDFECEGKNRRTQWCPSCTNKRKQRYDEAGKASVKNTREAMKSGRLCQVCNERPVANTHHKIPVSQGGTDEKENFLEVCIRCHYIQHNIDPVIVNSVSS